METEEILTGSVAVVPSSVVTTVVAEKEVTTVSRKVTGVINSGSSRKGTGVNSSTSRQGGHVEL